MSASMEQDRIVAQLREFPASVEAAVGGLDDEQLDAIWAEGEWTVRQIVHHVADSHMNLFVRMRLILTEENPTLRPFDQDKWARLADATRSPIEPSLSILKGIHQRSVELLVSLTEEGWQRPAYHPEGGPLTLGQLTLHFAHHCEAHLEQIGRARAALSR